MDSVHYNNRSGVRATCPDCHVPHEFVPKMIRKLKASKELYGKIFGVIDTPQKFEAHRLTMAQNEWRRMKDNNSQECRNCHNFEYMDTTAQKSVAAKMHDQAVKDGQTGIAVSYTHLDVYKRQLPLSLAKGELGHHYRFGWLEGNNGKS